MMYDKEDDILLLRKDKKVKCSIDIGDFIVDIDHKNQVTGIEILNASDNLNLTEQQLSSLKKASMKVTYKPNYIYISIVMQLKEKEKDISIPISIDLGHNKVKTENSTFAVA